jgi:hypothetical protein
MLAGILFAEVVLFCVVVRKAYSYGVMNGWVKLERRKWLNVLASPPVSELLIPGPHTNHVPSAEKFGTKDVKWAPDGKGFVLFDRDQFCCAFEVEDERMEI